MLIVVVAFATASTGIDHLVTAFEVGDASFLNTTITRGVNNPACVVVRPSVAHTVAILTANNPVMLIIGKGDALAEAVGN